MTNPPPQYDLRPVPLAQVRALCERFHGYKSAGSTCVYSFGVFEGDVLVAGYAWQPPPPGAAKAVCPEAPQAVLALSRMVAVPRDQRRLNHVSKPLRRQMKALIDRTRWPVLVTYSDEGQGHTGHVYMCSGWEKALREERKFFVDAEGHRVSAYANGKYGGRGFKQGGTTIIQRWEHWVCPRGSAAAWMKKHGWRRVPRPGKVWKSGNQAYKYVRETPSPSC